MDRSNAIDSYVVCGPGRCAGNLLMALIRAAGMNTVRTHDMKYTTGNDSRTAWIKVDRIDIFGAVCSNIIANRTGQTTHYNRKTITPFYVDRNEFKWFYKMHLAYREDYWTQRNFASIDHFWFEEFAHNPEVVWQRLKLEPDHALLEDPTIRCYTEVPAPYNYRDIIVNHEELRSHVVF